MVTLGLVLLCLGLLFVVYACGKEFKRIARERERERNVWNARESELLDRIMHQAGQTWTAPPRVEKELSEEEIEALERERKRREEGWTEV